MQQQVLSLGGGDLLQDEGKILRKIPHRDTAQRIGGCRLHLRDTGGQRQVSIQHMTNRLYIFYCLINRYNPQICIIVSDKAKSSFLSATELQLMIIFIIDCLENVTIVKNAC